MFKTPYINIDYHGIDILYNYQLKRHIEYREITDITIKKGFVINNWIVTNIIGLFLIFIGYNLFSEFNIKLEDLTYGYQVAQILSIPFLLTLGGLTLVIISFRRSKKLKIRAYDKIYNISIREIEKEGKMNKLIDFLDERVELYTKKSTNAPHRVIKGQSCDF